MVKLSASVSWGRGVANQPVMCRIAAHLDGSTIQFIFSWLTCKYRENGIKHLISFSVFYETHPSTTECI